MLFQPPEDRFRQLYKEYLPMVRGVLYNMTGESNLDDLIQESFIKIWKGLPQFDFRSSVKTWVYRVTVNTAIDYLRKPKMLAHTDVDSLKETSYEIDDGEQRRLIQAALMKIEEDQRSVIVLYYFEEMSVEEIAKVLKVPVGTVKSRLHTARTTLRSLLHKQGVTA